MKTILKQKVRFAGIVILSWSIIAMVAACTAGPSATISTTQPATSPTPVDSPVAKPTPPVMASTGSTFFRGTITDISGGKLALQDDAGRKVTLTVDNQTQIELPGILGVLTDLKVGSKVQATFDPASMRATEVDLAVDFPSPPVGSKVEGVITQFTGNALGIKAIDGSEVGIQLGNSTVIQRGGYGAIRNDLKVGTTVEVYYDPVTKTAARIEIRG